MRIKPRQRIFRKKQGMQINRDLNYPFKFPIAKAHHLDF
jgi:hypothetical protein